MIFNESEHAPVFKVSVVVLNQLAVRPFTYDTGFLDPGIGLLIELKDILLPQIFS
jgi:hypothetical protein